MFRRICEICLINLSCQFQLNRTCNHTCLCLYGICIFIRAIYTPIINETDLLWIPWCSFVFRVSLLDMSNIICLCRSIKISKLTSLNQTHTKNIIYLTSRNRSIATILQVGDNRGKIGLNNKSLSWMFEKGFLNENTGWFRRTRRQGVYCLYHMSCHKGIIDQRIDLLCRRNVPLVTVTVFSTLY